VACSVLREDERLWQLPPLTPILFPGTGCGWKEETGRGVASTMRAREKKVFVMAECPNKQQLGAYYDRQLDTAAQHAVEAHLASCGDCQREVAALAQISQLLDASPVPVFAGAVQCRLHASAPAIVDRPLRRMAWIVDAIAASILVATSTYMITRSSPASANPQAVVAPPWASLSRSGDSDTLLAGNPVAQWYLADASGRGEDAP